MRNLDSAKPLIEAYGERVVPLYLDLAKPETIEEASSKASDVEIVVNNAGILKRATPLSDNAVATLKCYVDYTTYSASKAAAYSVTQGLKEMLNGQGTKVFSIHPGHIATDMANDTGHRNIAEPPNVVADAIIRGMTTGQFHIFPDALAKQVGEEYKQFASNVIKAV